MLGIRIRFHESLLQKWCCNGSKSGVNVNVVCCCCTLLIVNKVQCCHCIQNYLIALATATPCSNPASCRSCIHLSIFVSTYWAVVSGRKRSFSMGKEFSWKAVHALGMRGRQSGGVWVGLWGRGTYMMNEFLGCDGCGNKTVEWECRLFPTLACCESSPLTTGFKY